MLGPVLGPVLGGAIVDNLSWRWMFYVNVPVCAIALLAAFYWLPRDTERATASRLDTLGLALLSPGLAALVYGLAQTGNGHGITDPRVYGWVAAGAVLVAAFTAHALRRGGLALVDLRLFRDRGFTASCAALFVYAGAIFGVTFMAPVYFQAVRGDSPLHAGLLLAPMGLGAMVSMPIAGRLTDRIGPRILTVTGLLIVLAGFSAYTRLDTGTSRTLLAAAMLVVGIGHGAMMPSLMAAVYQRLDRAAVPAATTASNIMVRVGSSFGVAALAVALQVFIRHEIPEAGGTVASVARTPEALSRLAHAFGHSFWWAAGIAAVSIIPILLLPPRETAPASVVETHDAITEPVDDRT
jgi:EmrB/QacA subfamily drug resistance transporter